MFKASQLALPLGKRHTIVQVRSDTTKIHMMYYAAHGLCLKLQISYAPPTCPVLTPFPEVVFKCHLRCLLLLHFERLLAIAPDHDNREERADHGGAKNDEDDGDANGPDAWQEEGVEEVVVVHERLQSSGFKVEWR